MLNLSCFIDDKKGIYLKLVKESLKNYRNNLERDKYAKDHFEYRPVENFVDFECSEASGSIGNSLSNVFKSDQLVEV